MYIKSIFVMVALAFGVAGNVVLAADAAAGKAKTAACAACHGATGISAIPMNPNLAGQKEEYLVTAMNDYKSGKRDNATMKAMVAALSDDDIKNVAAFYASQACK